MTWPWTKNKPSKSTTTAAKIVERIDDDTPMKETEFKRACLIKKRYEQYLSETASMVESISRRWVQRG